MSKKVNWWWVVATHKRGTVNLDEAESMNLKLFMNEVFAANVFPSREQAVEFKNDLKQDSLIPEGIKLSIVSDANWYLIMYAYLRGNASN